MPHINHRRGDTRRRSKHRNRRCGAANGAWNRCANQFFRAAIHRILQQRHSIEAYEDIVWPLQDEADDYWNYD
jgi:hypothetical protein